MILLESLKVKIKGSRISKTRAKEGDTSVFTSFLFPKAAALAKRGWGWESVSAIPASVERQNRKIFISLIEKIFARGRLKNVEKIFLFCSPKRSGGERKRPAGKPTASNGVNWAGLRPQSDN